jgi:hypothetical protein
MEQQLTIRAKELYKEGNSNIIIIKKLQDEFQVDSGTAGSGLQQALDDMEAFDGAEKNRYWNLIGGIVFLLLCVPGIFLVRIYLVFILGGIGLNLLRKGIMQIQLYNDAMKKQELSKGLLDTNL